MTEQVQPIHQARAGIYEMLALAYAQPTPDRLARVQGLSSRLEGHDIADHFDLASPAASFAAAAATSAAHELERDYEDLFVHSTGSRPRETAFLEPDADAKPVLDSVLACYSAFGLDPGRSGVNPPDFVGSELQFMGILANRRTACAERADTQDGAYRAAEEGFMREHLGRWVKAFAQRVELEAGTFFYRSLAGLTAAFTAADARFLGVKPGAGRFS